VVVAEGVQDHPDSALLARRIAAPTYAATVGLRQSRPCRETPGWDAMVCSLPSSEGRDIEKQMVAMEFSTAGQDFRRYWFVNHMLDQHVVGLFTIHIDHH
jgi:hypothetical protein